MKSIIEDKNGWPIEEVTTKSSRGWPVTLNVPGFESLEVNMQLAFDVSDSSAGQITLKPMILGPDSVVLKNEEDQEMLFEIDAKKTKFESQRGVRFFNNEAEVIIASVEAEVLGDVVQILKAKIENL